MLLAADADADGTGGITRVAGTVTASIASFQAAEGIGSSGAILTAVNGLTARNSSSGAIRIEETDNVTFVTEVRNDAAAAVLHIIAGGSIDTATAVTSTDAGPLFLDARGASADTIIGSAGVHSSGGQIQIRADRNIDLNGDIQAAGGNIVLAADADTDNTGAITRSAGTLVSNAAILNAAEGIGSAAAIVTDISTLTATNTFSGRIQVTQNIAGGNLEIDVVSNLSRDVSVKALNGSLTDANGAATNLFAANAILSAIDGSIGGISGDVFKGSFDPLELQLTGNLTASAPAGTIAVTGSFGGSFLITAQAASIVSSGNLNLATSTFTSPNLAIISAGLITLPDTGLLISDALRIEALDVDAATAGNDVILGSNGTRIDRILYKVDGAADETVQLWVENLPGVPSTPAQVDIRTNSNVQLVLHGDTQFTDLDCDLSSLNTSNQTATIQADSAEITQGAATGTIPTTQTNDLISSQKVLFTGSGSVSLQHLQNNVQVIAADFDGPLAYRDSDGLTVGTISAVSGITTSNDNLQLTVDAGDLAIVNQVNLGTGSASLAANSGNISLAAVVAVGSLNAAATGEITDVAGGAVSSSNLAQFQATTIALDNAAAHNFGQLRFNAAGAVQIIENSSTQLAGS
ncbi:MAG: beta strand repeat-containing protein, partial [Planctomycetaceae bacterium]